MKRALIIAALLLSLFVGALAEAASAPDCLRIIEGRTRYCVVSIPEQTGVIRSGQPRTVFTDTGVVNCAFVVTRTSCAVRIGA